MYGNSSAAYQTYLGLHMLQHRGQESAGIVSTNGKDFFERRKQGLVVDVFRSQEKITPLKGHAAVGEVRYSTTGVPNNNNVQPLVVQYMNRHYVIAHNGNITNALEWRRNDEEKGRVYRTTTDTEMLAYRFIDAEGETLEDKIQNGLKDVQGAYSLIVMNRRRLIAVKGPEGIRPLCLGKLGGAYFISSESCAFGINDIDYVREIKPGEMLTLSERGPESRKLDRKSVASPCLFEYLYFARPDSRIFSAEHDVGHYRTEAGRQLAREQPADADVIIAVPASGRPGAEGYAMESGIPIQSGLQRSHYAGRTFIEPEQHIRDFGLRLKLSIVGSVVQGKRVVVVDDSIVRGTTSRKLVNMVRRAGAREVHLRIHSPPKTDPCYYGEDTPTREELMASSNTVERMRVLLGADSLGFLSIEGARASVPPGTGYCAACFTGEYPTELPDSESGEHGKAITGSQLLEPGLE